MRPAQPVAQLLGERQAYRGGWPLGFTTATCPAEAPVGCKSSPSYNLNCCPSGQFCFGTLQPYCCPTGEYCPNHGSLRRHQSNSWCRSADADCGAAVKNVPVCANGAWNMFQIEQFGNRDFFCCPNGYTGVLPASGAAGICESSGANLPSSRLATMASQIGGTSVTPFGGVPTATLSGVAPHTTGQGAGTTTGTGTAAGGTSTGTSLPNNGEGGGSPAISIGAIAGIAVGGVALLVLAVALLLWLHRRSLRKRPPPAVAHNPLGDSQGLDQKAGYSQYGTPSQGWSQPSRSEAAGVSRVEMG